HFERWCSKYGALRCADCGTQLTETAPQLAKGRGMCVVRRRCSYGTIRKEPAFARTPRRQRDMNVVPFLSPAPRGARPLICFVDLQVEYVAGNRELALTSREPWTSNCRLLLSTA